jgi:hypothetical protein
MVETFDIASLYEQEVEAGFITEATKPRTLSAGLYRGIATKVEGRVVPEVWAKSGNPTKTPGRKEINIQWSLTTEEGAKAGVQFGVISPEVYRWHEKQLYKDSEAPAGAQIDAPSRHLAQLMRVFDTNKMDVMLNGIKEQQVGVYITESFKRPKPEGGFEYLKPKTAEERDEYLKAGYEAVNEIQSYSKLK